MYGAEIAAALEQWSESQHGITRQRQMTQRRIAQMACARCVGDRYLARVVDKRSSPRTCSFCGKVKHVADIAAVALAADDRLAQVAHRVTPFEDPVDLAVGVRYDSDGRTVQGLVEANLSRARAGVAAAIGRELLAIGKARRAKEAEPAWSGRHRYSAASVPFSSAELEELWQQYLGLVNDGARFFNEGARQFLDGLFDAMHRLSVDGLFKHIVPIQERHPKEIYRARLASTSSDVERILGDPAGQLNAPPPELARAGRMNAERVAVFYGAFDSETAVAELRPGIGGRVAVGKFSLKRPVRLLDMPILERSSGATISIWDPEYKERAAMRALLRRLHERVTRPVVPGAEHDYLATQVLAECVFHAIPDTVPL